MAEAAPIGDAAGRGRPPTPFSTAIICKSLSSFVSSLPVLLLVSFLILLVRSALLAGTLRLSSLPDTDPLLRSLLSRLSPPASSSSSSSSSTPRFLHLSPAIPLADDFFPSSPLLRRQSFPNSSFSEPIPIFLSPDYRALARAPRLRPRADPHSRILFYLPSSEVSSHDGEDQGTRSFSFGKDGLEVAYLLSLLSSAHAIAILFFMFCYSAALGVVWYAVAWFVLSRPTISLTQAIPFGVKLGIRRLVGFVFLKWAIRDTLVQLLCVCFFANIEDQRNLFKLFIKVKLMPFSLTVLSGNEVPALPGFLLIWGVVDFFLAMAFVLVPGIMAMDDNIRRRGQEVVKEGVFLVTLVPWQSFWIKCLEMVLCGRLGRLVLSTFSGRRFAMWVQAILEVYFMALWFILYLEARRKDSELGGRRFGREELERCIDKI
ncbi:hypothetical protein HPP92_014717 [Vanilla planifolia]|uniref:Transmembrane protein n=1 Tax=Vanilla planifolia TaxID=51239 RepID=A0A835UX57_VANPL|nr:hypothetical protein HPP92_014717 [Vanilla planifolia]